MPGFFKHMPPKEEWFKKGRWDIVVTAIFFHRTNDVSVETYEGRLIGAYVKLRLKALMKDLATEGSYYGIGWEIRKPKDERQIETETEEFA